MEGGNWVGEKRQSGKGVQDKVYGGQERRPEGQETEWKEAALGSGRLGSTLEGTRDLGGETILSGLIGSDLSQNAQYWVRSPHPGDREGLKLRDRVTNPQSKFLTQNCSCLK